MSHSSRSTRSIACRTRCNAGFEGPTNGRPIRRSSDLRTTASSSRCRGCVCSQCSQYAVENPGETGELAASGHLYPYTFGNPRSYGDRGHFGLTTHSTNCTHRTMVRGDHRGKACQGPYHDPNHDADSRSVVPPEVPKDVR